jgi:hypothetical protein
MNRSNDELKAAVRKIVGEVRVDPNLPKLTAKYRRRYSTLTEQDLQKVFTI